VVDGVQGQAVELASDDERLTAAAREIARHATARFFMTIPARDVSCEGNVELGGDDSIIQWRRARAVGERRRHARKGING
jgi:hypothetical protein